MSFLLVFLKYKEQVYYAMQNPDRECNVGQAPDVPMENRCSGRHVRKFAQGCKMETRTLLVRRWCLQ